MPAMSDGAVTASLAAVVLWVARTFLLRVEERFRRMDGGYRRREAALIKTAGWLADARATKPLPRV